MTIFGNIITATQVRRALTETVELWISTYLNAVLAVNGYPPNSLPVFRSYVQSIDLDTWPGDQLPACVIIAPGLLQEPTETETGYRAVWSVAVAPVASGQTRDRTLENVEMYTAAVRTLIVQHGSLGGFALGVEWLNERYDTLGDSDEQRTLAVGTVQFAVEVESASEPELGPMDVETIPEDVEWPEVSDVTITLNQESLNGAS